MFDSLMIKHWYNLFFPRPVPKKDDALRFGILGAANIAPMALIIPAKSHPEVIVAAVAARDPKKAEAYAKKHDIPIVHKTYEDLIADPSLDVIYNPLPNGLHYEWTIKALQAGKHVLLEKPSVSNANEAKSLFRHPLLSQPNAPVLLEAFHYRFHPAWQTFLKLFKPEEIEEAHAQNWLPAGVFPTDDIRFNYSLSGGTLMDFGTYASSSLRQVFNTEATDVEWASYRHMPPGCDQECDHAMWATYKFPGGGVGKIEADLAARGGYSFPWLTKNLPRVALPKITVTLKPKDEGEQKGLKKTVRRKLVFYNYMAPQFYHRVDIIDTIELRKPQDDKVVKSTMETRYLKAYEWPEKGEGKVGEEWWGTYRHQLEEFVNRVKGRKGSGVWVDGEDSIKQMEMIDKTYLKAGLPLRPTSKALSS